MRVHFPLVESLQVQQSKWVGVTLVLGENRCHIHRRVVAGLTGGDADDLRGEPALIPLTVHP